MWKYVSVLLLMATAASAQTTTSYVARFYDAGAASPRSTYEFDAAQVVCNQAPPTTTSTVNPTTFYWDDEGNDGKTCKWVDPGTGPLFALPFGVAYEATLARKNAEGMGPESARAGFSRLGPPTAAPANVKVVRPGS